MPEQKADRDFGKRKHSIGAAKVGDALGRSRMQKHKRTWPIPSVSSADEGNSARASSEEDFHFQLQTLQDMFTSTRPVGALYLRGEELDDSDLHPVLFPGDACPMTRLKDCSIIFPLNRFALTGVTSFWIGSGGQWQGLDPLGIGDASRKGSKAPTRIRKTENDGVPNGWIEALEVDPLYKPPEERGPKPAVCFCVLCSSQGTSGGPKYHQAISMLQLTLKELDHRIAAKWGLGPSKIGFCGPSTPFIRALK
ncbi:hypothetical protein FOBRF1_007454 [Fusarium oxysporum]